MRSPLGTVAVVLVAAVVATGCGDASTTDTTPTTSGPTVAPPTTVVPLELTSRPPESYDEYRAQPTACGAQAPPPATEMTFSGAEDLGLDPAQVVRVTIETSCGDLVVELDPSLAPTTVNSFVFLARQGYFDGTASHRVLPGFVMQAGDPTGTGRGNPGYAIPDELPPAEFAYERGTLAMANAGPNTGGSQFFIMLADAGLPPAYSVFGRVVDGLDVLDRIAALPLGDRQAGFNLETSVPLETVYLERVVVDD